MMDEITQITDYIQDEAGLSADIIWGNGKDEELGDNISITLIATGFEANKSIGGIQSVPQKEKVVHNLKEQNTPVPEERKSISGSAVEPEIKATQEPQVAQTKMELDVPALQKSEPASSQNPIQSIETVHEVPKIVHNLYDEEEIPSKIDTVKEVPKEQGTTFNFSPSSDATKAESTKTKETKIQEDSAPTFDVSQGSTSEVPPTFEPTFNEVPPVGHWEAPAHSEPSKQEEVRNPSTFADELDTEEKIKRSQQRLSQLNNLTAKLKNPSNILDLENEPAYIRRQVRLDNVKHSSENNASRFTLGNDGENNPEIRPNNSFLHDNVD
jgi:cell division protein FtsZ